MKEEPLRLRQPYLHSWFASMWIRRIRISKKGGGIKAHEIRTEEKNIDRGRNDDIEAEEISSNCITVYQVVMTMRWSILRRLGLEAACFRRAEQSYAIHPIKWLSQGVWGFLYSYQSIIPESR